MTNSVHIVGDGLIEGHMYLFCADNLIQIFWFEGTTSSTDVNLFFSLARSTERLEMSSVAQ